MADANPYTDSPDPREGPRKPFLGRIPRTALAAGIAVGLGVGGAGIAFAASGGTSSSGTPAASSPSSSVPGPNSTKGPFKHAFRVRGPFGRLRGLGRLGNAVHGEFTIKAANGAYKTIEFQTGQVRSVSSTSITVVSSDGYTHTYAVTPNTVVDSQAGGISSVAGKDQVTLMATPANGKDTATNVLDTTKVQGSRRAFGFAPPSGAQPSTGTQGGTSGWGFQGPAPAEAQ